MTDRVLHKVPLTTDLHRQIRLAAADQGTTMNAVILAAIRAHLGIPEQETAPGIPMDPLVSFVSDLCECSPEYEIASRTLYEAFRDYGSADDMRVQHASVFGAAIQSACPGVSSARVRRDGRLTYIYRGIRLRNPKQ